MATTQSELQKLARELRAFGWAPMAVAPEDAAYVAARLRNEQHIDATFIDGDFDIWILTEHWGSTQFESWRDFGEAHRDDDTLTPEAHGIFRKPRRQ